MKTKTNLNGKDFEKWMRSVIDRYVPILMLQRHRIYIKKGCEGKNSNAECLFRYPYLDAEIRYSPSLVEMWKKRPEEAKTIVIHELCHIITDPFYSKAASRYVSIDEIRDERENLTDLISNIVIKNNL